MTRSGLQLTADLLSAIALWVDAYRAMVRTSIRSNDWVAVSNRLDAAEVRLEAAWIAVEDLTSDGNRQEGK